MKLFIILIYAFSKKSKRKKNVKVYQKIYFLLTMLEKKFLFWINFEIFIKSFFVFHYKFKNNLKIDHHYKLFSFWWFKKW